MIRQDNQNKDENKFNCVPLGNLIVAWCWLAWTYCWMVN